MRDIVNLPKDLAYLQQDIADLLRDMLDVIGTEGVKEVVHNFEVGGPGWQKRVSGTPKDYRPILVDRNVMQTAVTYEITGLVVEIGVNLARVPYAKIQNEGGTIPVTDKMKRFFWAKFAASGNKDTFWKHLALTKKASFEIPKREFLVIRDWSEVDKGIQLVIDNFLKKH